MKNYLLTVLMSSFLLLSSCIVNKKVLYVEDMKPDTAYRAIDAPPIKVQKRDRLSIIVGARTPELAAPFNQGTTNITWNETTKSPSSSSVKDDTGGYLVDEQGFIEFPILGPLRVEGLYLSAVKERIRSRLIEERLINEPTVKIELKNLKISMLGEVEDVGVLQVPDAQITLMEAITMAGGLTINAAPDRITVIREENGMRQVYVNDIQSQEIFNSPVYYLRQNDIVYVEPRYAEVTPRTQNNWRYITSGVGLVVTVLTILNLFK